MCGSYVPRNGYEVLKERFLMHPSSRVKLMSTFGLLLSIVVSLAFFGFMRGTSQASGTFKSSTRSESTAVATTSKCGSWQNVPVRYPPLWSGNYGFVGVAAIAPNNVWAVGDYIEHWDGSKWSKVNPRIGLNGIAVVSANNNWAVGGTNGSSVDGVSHTGGNAVIEHWNGSKWSPVPGANLGSISSYLNAITAISANNIWAVGKDDNGTLIEHWNGFNWSAVPSPSRNSQYDELTSISAVSANDIWTVGSPPVGYSPVISSQPTLIEHWNGVQWSIVSSPNPLAFNSLIGVTAISTNNVWAVGEAYENNGGESIIEHWNGVQWSLTSSTVGDALYATTAVSANNVWAVGFGSNGALTEHWTGSSWNVVKSPNLPGSWLLAVAQVPGTNTLWAVGSDWPPMSDYSNMITEFYC